MLDAQQLFVPYCSDGFGEASLPLEQGARRICVTRVMSH